MPRMPAAGERLNVEVLTDKIRALLGGDDSPRPGAVAAASFHPALVRAVEGERVVLALDPAGRPAPALHEGTSLILHYHDEDGLYLLLGKVINQPGPDGVAVQVKGAVEHQRRREARKRVALPVRYKLRREGEVALELFDWRQGRTHDISRNGLLLVADEVLAPGDHLDVELQLMGKTVAAEGRVTRVRQGDAGEHRAGVRFTRILPADQEAIGWFVVS